MLEAFVRGDALCVAPVGGGGASWRRVVLPGGRWHDVWDPTRMFEGPREVTVDAPIGRPPVFSPTPRTDLLSVR